MFALSLSSVLLILLFFAGWFIVDERQRAAEARQKAAEDRRKASEERLEAVKERVRVIKFYYAPPEFADGKAQKKD
jgi:hypothetical protein